MPRLMTAAAVALVVAALAAFAWFAGGSTAGAAGTSGGGSAPSGQFRPVQSNEQGTPDPADRDGALDAHDGTPPGPAPGGGRSVDHTARWRSKPGVDSTRRSLVMHIAS